MPCTVSIGMRPTRNTVWWHGCWSILDIIEEADWPHSETILAKASVVIVAVPISFTSAVIQRLNNLPIDCILADVTSIKESPLAAMKEVHAGPVVGLHPMFGPDVTGLIKQTIIVWDLGQNSGSE